MFERRTECAALDGMIAAVREGESRTLVVRGEAGVGKTALVEYAVDAASDLRVVRAVVVESELQLVFCLASAVRADARSSGAPSGSGREAVRIVFGLTAGPRPDKTTPASASRPASCWMSRASYWRESS